MAEKTIVVTPEQLEKTAGVIEGLASDYQTQYKTLYSKTDALAANWKGDDNMAFVNQIAGFKDNLKHMYDLMNRYADFLRKSADAYRKAQEAAIAEAKNLKH